MAPCFSNFSLKVTSAAGKTTDVGKVPGRSCSTMRSYNETMIHRANVADVSALGQIINDCAEYGLNIMWANLAEVYALGRLRAGVTRLGYRSAGS